jgi:acyl-coenzyme A thioesterase PaaI-like protein
MNKSGFTLSAWQRMSQWPGGKWMFSKLVCLKAPYFSSINPRFEVLRPGYCEVHIRKRRAVLNHIGTVHAIAMCNMAELAGGTMTEVSIPATHRWIPKGMTVEYLKKAETSLRAIAELEPVPVLTDAAELPVTVRVLDMQDNLVFRAVISMWVSPKSGQTGALK